MNVALFTDSIGQNNAQPNINEKPETAGSIALISTPKKASPLFEARKDEAVTPDAIKYTMPPETAGSIASLQGLDGQGKTENAGNSLSLAA